MLEELIAHIIVMQFPVVAIVAILAFQARRTFHSKAFRLVGLGWALNLAYLFCQNFATSSSPLFSEATAGLFGALANPFVLLSSLCFWYAGRLAPAFHSPLLLPRLSDKVFLLVLILLFLWTEGLRLRLEPHYPEYLLVMVPDVLIDMIGILTMAHFFYAFSRQHSTQIPSPNFHLVASTVLYAVIQPLYFFTLDVSPQTLSVVNSTGFVLGLCAKIGIFFGLMRLFSDAAVKAREEETRTREARNTVERIAHELGTPIAEMIVHTGILREEALLRGRFSMTLDQLQGALHRIEAIMDASKDIKLLQTLLHPISVGTEGGIRHEQLKEIAKINTLVQIALMAVKATRDEGVKFLIHYSANACIRCTSVEIVQVMINILRNAYDSMISGTGRVTVTTKNTDYQTVLIAVQDDGEGILPEVEERMFQNGFSTRGGPGRGFGLAVVRDLVKLNEGDLRVLDVARNRLPGERGCRVELEFPRVACR